MSALGDAWLSEMWGYCREVPYGERVEKRKADRLQQQKIEDREAVNNASTAAPPVVEESSTGCAETRGQETAESAA